MSRDVYEVSTVGGDEALQGFTSDPLGSYSAVTTGLRVPSLVPAGPKPGIANRYLFCVATRTISKPTRIRGIRQLLKLGINVAPTTTDGVVERPVEFNVTTPDFRFPDGNVSWHLVREPNIRTVLNYPLTQAQSFAFADSAGPALLYHDATWSAGFFNPRTGAPLYYNLGMLTYTPPSIIQNWQAIGGLGNMHEIRFPWDDDHAWDSLDIPIDIQGGQQRISLYASVLQTNPASAQRAVSTTPPGTPVYESGMPPEEAFILNYTTAGDVPKGPIFWRVGGAIIFEDNKQCVDNPRTIPFPGSSLI